MFPEALADEDEFARVAGELAGAALMANMTEWGKSPMLTLDELGGLGYQLVIFPAAPMRAAQRAVVDMLQEIKAKGTQREALDRMFHRHELYATLGLDQVHAWEREFGAAEPAETPR